MKRSLLSLSPLISSTNVCFRTHLLAGLKPRLCLSARPSSSSTVPLTRILHGFRTPPSTLREQSILQFLSSRLAQATHRSGIRGGRAGGGFGGGPQGPWQRLRARINAIPSNYIFWGIIGLNGLVFVSWNLAWAKYVRPVLHLLCISLGLRLGCGRSKAREMPPRTYGCGETSRRLRRTCRAVDGTYTNLSPRTLRETRPIRWTVVTSCFSHESSMHILFNGFTYYFMAPLVLSILGNVGFLGLYLGGMPPPFWSHGADAHPSECCRRHRI